jgi:MmyB-like transcription regulator ligand binding domain
VRELHRGWDDMTARLVPYLRSVPDADDPRLARLVGELSLRSDRFLSFWARQDVRHKSTGTSHLRHPEAGDLELRYEKLLIPASDMRTLVTYHADPGSDSEDRLGLLAAISAPAPAAPVLRTRKP